MQFRKKFHLLFLPELFAASICATYSFLFYIQKVQNESCFFISPMPHNILRTCYVTGQLSPPRAMPLFIIPENPQPLQNRPRPDTQVHLRCFHPSESRTLVSRFFLITISSIDFDTLPGKSGNDKSPVMIFVTTGLM